MNNSLSISRRSFIKVVSIAGSGLALGFRLASKNEIENGILDSEIQFVPNAWLRIIPNGSVTITVARSEMGQGVYTSMAMLVAEELEADWKSIIIEQAKAHPTLYGSQSTGGSWSVRGSYTILRKAGATAREMLISAAASHWNIDRSRCRAENGFILHPDGSRLSFGELCIEASKLDPPAEVPLKEENKLKFLGKRIPKLDSPDKVYGKALFGIDTRIPNMLYASIERCPVFGGKVVDVDDSKALQMPGVSRIVKVDSGVAVVAASTWQAFEGRKALNVTWDYGAWKDQSTTNIRKVFQEASTKGGTIDATKGNVEEAFTQCATIIEAVYEIPFVAHATMEPMNCIADVRDTTCEIWAPSQNPQLIQREASRILGFDMENVIVNVTLLGGGFGRRLNADYAVDAIQVSKAIGAPVQVVWTREDDMTNDFYRPGTYNVLKGGLDANGMPIAWMHRIVGPNSRSLIVGGSKPSYNIPNYQIDFHLIEIGVPVGAWRSVGPSQNAFIIESFIDELAFAAKQDPVAFRLKLLENAPRSKRALSVVAEKAKWNEPVKKGIGRGVSVVESFGSAAAQVAEVSVTKDGKIKLHRIVCAIDCGPVVNPDTIEAQIESGIVYALSAALKDEITFENGKVIQNNFDSYRVMLFDEMPKVEVHIIKSAEPIGGIGEPAVPPAAPAVCNAIFAATGKRIRRLPVRATDLVMK